MFGKFIILKAAFFILLGETLLFFRLNKKFKSQIWFQNFKYLYFLLVLYSILQFWNLLTQITYLSVFFDNYQPLFFKITYIWGFSVYGYCGILTVYYAFIFLRFVFFKAKNLILTKETKSKKIIHTESSITRKDFLYKTGFAIGTFIDASPFLGTVFIASGLFLGSKEILIENISIKIHNLPEAFKGYKIVQISDIHIGKNIDETYLKYCQGLIKSIKADLLVITGDTIDINNYYLKYAMRFFTSLLNHFRDGILAIPGNHDYFDDGEEFSYTFQKSKIKLLRNENYIIKRGKKQLNIIGLDYAWPHHGNGGKRMKQSKLFYKLASHNVQKDFPAIVLNHHPTDFLWLQNKPVDLMLSGHTHGGQINFSKERNSILSPVGWVFKYYKGHYQENGSHLYVSRGLGNSFPVRINSNPEITVIKLV